MPRVAPAISSNLPCARCSYNLRGLRPSSVCPECGHPIPLTLDDLEPPDYPLTDAPPGYVRCLLHSLTLLLLAYAAAALTPPVVQWLSVAIFHGKERPREAAIDIADLLVRALLCASVLLLTRRERSEAPSAERLAPAMLVLRVAAVASLGVPLLLRPGDISLTALALPLWMTAVVCYLGTGFHYWYLSQVSARLVGARSLTSTLRLMVLGGPAFLILAGAAPADTAYLSPLPTLTLGQPISDFAAVYHPLAPGGITPVLAGLAPAFVDAWVIYLLVRLWLRVRGALVGQ